MSNIKGFGLVCALFGACGDGGDGSEDPVRNTGTIDGRDHPHVGCMRDGVTVVCWDDELVEAIPSDAGIEPDASSEPRVEVIARNAFTIDELRELPIGTPGFVRTDIGELTDTEEVELVDLEVTYLGLISSPLTQSSSDPYPVFETAESDSRWAEWGGACRRHVRFAGHGRRAAGWSTCFLIWKQA